MSVSKVRIIAIYLPQYHPIPENDAVWGKGFTEWTNVVQARPLFKGHYQPRIPRDLGFYDLRLPEVREAQAQMAQSAGIEGFMYWQYYFGNEKKLLERPFEEVLKSGKPDFPFCLGWANHSWQTKTWKLGTNERGGNTVIMEQRYDGEHQYKDHFMYNLPAFRDRRYITVDGKPFFVIWNPFDHPEEIKLFIKTWRQLAKENGLKGIHFVASHKVGCNLETILDMGFDAVYQTREYNALLNADCFTTKVKIQRLLHRIIPHSTHVPVADFGKRYPMLVSDEAIKDYVYPMLLSGYDRTPRAGKDAMIFHNFTPENWRKHVVDVFKYIKEKDYEHNIVMLKSWNEWGEGNYMEPDLKYGTAFLDVLKEEIANNF